MNFEVSDSGILCYPLIKSNIAGLGLPVTIFSQIRPSPPAFFNPDSKAPIMSPLPGALNPY
jgi:hypothetical protein